MEGSESTPRERTTGQAGNQEADLKPLMSSKPLHRFIRKEPRILGIVIVIFGCAEILMGFQLTSENVNTSCTIYVPFWQGALFLVCGSLSIYTEVHPSKKMVTVCLAMYVVSLLGIIVSVGYRLYCFSSYNFIKYGVINGWHEDLTIDAVEQLIGIEGILFTSSLCVLVILIFLSAVARLALRSTHTQIIVHCILGALSDTTSD
ncbi:membrane-spanning 4-domains subfamily A member 4D-like [Micropterus salmoides]|uniref:membrane-spanning 4-domains subfamily A member 4D-like n=1 Tax=Micropterus salmoides TaxID=27706 RepID=UPI0018ED9264|nr:membrane-spanning 4-domains subfamily A member 4D-like [Micropterus salmoides]XP_038555214.1 membrane-spanning 4-domains subfamily A member 4D-like [Micropterus salmoides]XP_038555215.1 membrane-spanning 4-domains subfamily A member 4D-like [Micropterus salmoides]